MKNKITITCDSLLSKMNKTVKELGLNYSENRDFILRILYEENRHLCIEDITDIVNSRFDLKLSKTTVYSIINFFEEMQIVRSIVLSKDIDKKSYYEINISYHHDHLICTKCNKIIEFFDPSLEEHQMLVCEKNNFTLFSHSLILYGVCESCQKT